MNITTPLQEQRFNPMLDASIFGDIEPNKVRFAKPKSPKFQKKQEKRKPESFKISTPKKLKPVSKSSGSSNLFDTKLIVGNIVNHQRFGRGEVIKIEGTGGDLKAEIKFENGDTKKLLLRFAKLEVIG